MDKELLKRQLIAYRDGTLGEADSRLLLEFIDSGQHEALLGEVLAELITTYDEDMTLPIASEDMYRRIVQQARFNTKRKINTYRWIASIAAAVVMLLGGIWWYTTMNPNDVIGQRKEMVRLVTGSPTDRLVLKVAGGASYDIDEITKGQTMEASPSCFALEEGGIRYDATLATQQEEVVQHSLVTPKGRQFKVVLSDGTRVWLNAATTLSFPSKFVGKERVVNVDGEAYFEVEKSKDKPFIVRTPTQEIKVLGTHFNVLSYKEDAQSFTTLLEGKVEVSHGGERKILLPGQQAVSRMEQPGLRVSTTAVADAIAWKDNLFVFHGEDIVEAMRQVSRWYDVDVEYREGMEGKHIAGSIPRYDNIKQMMEALAATGLLKYKIEGGIVSISQ